MLQFKVIHCCSRRSPFSILVLFCFRVCLVSAWPPREGVVLYELTSVASWVPNTDIIGYNWPMIYQWLCQHCMVFIFLMAFDMIREVIMTNYLWCESEIGMSNLSCHDHCWQHLHQTVLPDQGHLCRYAQFATNFQNGTVMTGLISFMFSYIC